ncbi:MAG: response regulator transcription factor [Ruminococcus flavefaciens]|nr:response regulator transcription factor [Ruminococcus flavefaciens]
MSVIYIVEDDKNIQEIESYAIKGNGYDVRAFDDAEAFDRGMQEMKPDLLLLDVMLPGEDGLSVLKRLRSNNDTKELPVILVTAKDSEIDTVRGLDLGADDYITKPFGVMELMSRIKAIMRRIKPMSDDVVLKYKNIYLDQDRRICLVDEESVELTFKEYELLRLFLSNLGIVLTREMIMETVWGTDFTGESRTVDVHIKTLRKKLKEAGSLIVTVRNVGYKLE